MATEKKAKPEPVKKADRPAKAGKRRPPVARNSPNVTTAEARKAGRERRALYDLRQPQYPREELVTDARGNLSRRELPPQSRATWAEFRNVSPLAEGGFMIPGS